MSALLRLGAGLALILIAALIVIEIPPHIELSKTGFAVKQTILPAPQSQTMEKRIHFIPSHKNDSFAEYEYRSKSVAE